MNRNIEVPCPCGQSCKGVGSWGQITKCFLSETGYRMPYKLRSLIDNDSGTGWKGFVNRAALTFLTNFSDKNKNIEYFTYQCPSCGCEVYFISSINNGSPSFKRLGDTSSC